MSALSVIKTIFLPSFHSNRRLLFRRSFSLAWLFATSAPNMRDLIQHIALQPNWLSTEAVEGRNRGNNIRQCDNKMLLSDNSNDYCCWLHFNWGLKMLSLIYVPLMLFFVLVLKLTDGRDESKAKNDLPSFHRPTHLPVKGSRGAKISQFIKPCGRRP